MHPASAIALAFQITMGPYIFWYVGPAVFMEMIRLAQSEILERKK